MKKLVAYSSISHMGFVTLGMFLFVNGQLNDWALKGAIIQMISHGFVSAAMFMCIGVMYDRLHTRNIADYGGVVNVMPKFAAFMMLFGMANAGLPATSGFVGEFMVIMGAVKVEFLGRRVGCYDLDLRCVLYPVDVQTRYFWCDPQSARCRNERHQLPRVCDFGDFGGCCFGHGSVSASVYRSGASSGKRFDCPCGTKQDLRCVNELV